MAHSRPGSRKGEHELIASCCDSPCDRLDLVRDKFSQSPISQFAVITWWENSANDIYNNLPEPSNCHFLFYATNWAHLT